MIPKEERGFGKVHPLLLSDSKYTVFLKPACSRAPKTHGTPRVTQQIKCSPQGCRFPASGKPPKASPSPRWSGLPLSGKEGGEAKGGGGQQPTAPGSGKQR